MSQMHKFQTRDVLPFPKGANDSDTVFGGVHLNLTALRFYNYTYYGNETLSNETDCVLAFKPYQPAYLFGNGSFVNTTSCYSAVDPIQGRGFVGIGLAVAYCFSLILSITALAKQGKRYLPVTKRFFPISRRWQWYWALFVCACAMISLLINVDVDRYRVQELPIVVTCFFWFLVCQGTTALVWEAVRHWGSWQERQYVDPDPFILRVDDKRAKLEFWLPLWFYFWVWMNFFLVVPRNWTFIEHQRSEQQIIDEDVPGTGTSGRFKAGAFCLVVAWLTICFSLRHSIQHYKARNRGIVNRARGFVTSIPLRLLLLIVINAALIAYQIFQSFVWEYSLLRFHGVVAVQFGWGFGPPLLIMLIQVIFGFTTPNEDKELIRQRRERGEIIDRELGLVKQPAWWRRVRGEHIQVSLRDKIKRNVNEVGGVQGTGRRAEADIERHAREEAALSAAAMESGGIEMGNIPHRPGGANPRVDRAGAGRINADGSTAMASSNLQDTTTTRISPRRDSELNLQAAANMLFPNNNNNRAFSSAATTRHLDIDAGENNPPPPYSDGNVNTTRLGDDLSLQPRANSTSTANSTSGAQPQQIRSMLDV